MKDRLRHIKKLLADLPTDRGVYLMKDINGKIIYVGKAKSLKARVSSYFQERGHEPKTSAMIDRIWDFEIIIVESEVEALLVERSMIKHHNPPFNIKLTDDKEYPYVRVNLRDDWPRFSKVRRRKNDGATYLGPFPSSASLKVTMDMMNHVFPLIRCTPHVFRTVTRPCNYYQMKLCLGPCKLPVEREHYLGIVKEAVDFLRGNNKELVRDIKHQMKEAAESEKYERAAHYRDILQALENVMQRQSVFVDIDEADILGHFAADELATVAVIQIRDGRLVNQEVFYLKVPLQNHDEVMQAFILQYYENRYTPKELIVAGAVVDSEINFAEAVKADHKVLFTIPQRGKKKDLLEMAEKNAGYHFEQQKQESNRRNITLEMVMQMLKLDKLPRRIECIDISNLGAIEIVASNVCFIDGKPAKEFYRQYIIKQTAGEQNDFAAIEEVVARRLQRAERDGDAPDVLMIDGGKGQLNAALKAAEGFPDHGVSMISIAKSRTQETEFTDKEITYSDERLYVDPEKAPKILVPGSSEFRLFTSLRDEAHRVAISFHRKRRDKKTMASSLLEVAGIGPKLYEKLIREFGGMVGLRQASLDQLKAIKGLSEDSAVALFAQLQEETDVGEG